MKRCFLLLLTASFAGGSMMAFPLPPEPQPLDSAGAARALAQITPAAYPGATAVIAYDRQREEYTATGTSVLERAALVKTLSDLGVRDYAQLRVSYSPQYDRAEFLWARLIKASGEIVPLRVDSLEDAPQPASEWGTIFWGERDKTLTIAGLEPGDAVEYATRGLGGLWQGPGSLRDSLALLDKLATPYRGQFNRMVMFQDDQPVREMTYTVSGPNTLPLKFAVFNGTLSHTVAADSFTSTHCWSARDVPAIADEPRMPSRYDVGLKLIVTTVPSWEWMSRFDYGQADSCLQPDQAIRDKAAELTRDLPDDRSKIRALCYYVAHNIRYLGLTVGDAEGYQPHPARMTFRQKAGVCKDKAGLLVALLNAAGYRAWYTTTAAGSRIEDIPADQANHAIVAFADGRGGIEYCDPTMATETAEILPAHERRQQVLIARSEGDRLRQIPLLPADSNRLEVTDRCAIDMLGNITGTLTLRGSGGQDGHLRSQFWQPRSAWDRIAQDIVRQLGAAASVTSFSHTDPDSLWQPMAYEIGYVIPGGAFRVGQYRMLQPGLARFEPWWTDPGRAIALPERRYPVDLRSNFTLAMEELIALPAGWQAVSMPQNRKSSHRNGSWSVAVTQGTGQVVYRRQATLSDPLVRAGDYRKFRRSMLDYLDTRQGWVVLKTD